MYLESYTEYLVGWIKNMVKKAGASGCIIGISGGVDSAVCAFLVKKAMHKKCLAVVMPCHSNPDDESDAMKVINECKIPYVKVDLTSTYDTLISSISELKVLDKSSEGYKIAIANTKARLRMTTLYSFAKSLNYIVVGTDNACEWYTGYFTKFGDGGVDIVPIIGLTKKEVRDVGKILGVPEAIIKRRPTAGLIVDVYDEDELKVTYEEIDNYLLGKKISQSSVDRIEHLHNISEHKRNLAKSPRLPKRK